ncbi:MAG: Ig-like domain-containing protein [Clostridia bacterium]|nr:Ig-like domain-containing protein [Clostridia bacterium]
MKGNDAQFLDSEADIQKLARADCNALVAFYGLEKKDPSRVSSITLNKQSMVLTTGEKEILQATVKPDTATNKKVTWSSSNTEVAIVSEKGEVTAKKAGKATITAKTEDRGKTATCEVTVQETNITLSKKETNLLVGKKAQIDYAITPETVSNKTVTWKSSDETIATISKEGIITALKEGTTNITAILESENKQATIKVNVHKLEDGQKMELDTIKEDNDKLSKIGEKVTVSEFKKKIKVSDKLEVIAKDSKNNVLKEDSYITTNTQIQIQTKEKKEIVQEYDCLIYGDVNCDGKISALDFTLIENHIMDIQKITNSNAKLTANVNGDSKISALDFTLIENHIMDIQKIPLK